MRKLLSLIAYVNSSGSAAMVKTRLEETPNLSIFPKLNQINRPAYQLIKIIYLLIALESWYPLMEFEKSLIVLSSKNGLKMSNHIAICAKGKGLHRGSGLRV